MKVIRFVSLLAAAFFVLFAPTAAMAAPYPGTQGGVSATPPTAPDENGCSTTQVTVTGAPGDTLTLVVRGPGGAVVDRQSKPAGADGSATFTVTVCGAGSYTATGTNQDGDVLGSTQFDVAGTSQGGGAAGGNGTAGNGSGAGAGAGNLPDTGADSGTMLTLVGALALLMVGAVTLVAAKRKAL